MSAHPLVRHLTRRRRVQPDRARKYRAQAVPDVMVWPWAEYADKGPEELRDLMDAWNDRMKAKHPHREGHIWVERRLDDDALVATWRPGPGPSVVYPEGRRL